METWMTITTGEWIEERSFLDFECNSFDLQLERSVAYLREQKLRLMKEYLKMLWSGKLDSAERILARAEYKALAKADIEIDRKQGLIKMLDVTMQIVKRL